MIEPRPIEPDVDDDPLREEGEELAPQEWVCWLCGASGSDPCQHSRPWECPSDRG